MVRFLLFSFSLLFFTCTRQNSRPDQTDMPQPHTETTKPVAIPAFDGARAFSHLTAQTAFGPRTPNSQAARECLGYLNEKLQTTADTVVLQEFTHAGYDGVQLRLTNVFASFRGTGSDRILLIAHWDSRPRAEQDEHKERRNEGIPGANDGASGVAVLLEIASLLKSSPPPVGVDILLTDGEDYGLEGDLDNYFLGARHFVRTKPVNYVPRFGILLDMVGDTYLEIPKEYYSVQFAPDIVDLVWKKAHELGFPQFVDEPGDPVSDDHLPFNEAGIKTIDLIDFNYPDPTNRFWHTHQDTPDKCSPESLNAVGTVLVNVVYSLRP